MVLLSRPYMNTGKTIALTRWTSVSKEMSLLFNMLPRLVITFLPRSKWQEELPHVQGKEWQLHFAGAAVKRYLTAQVREAQVRW